MRSCLLFKPPRLAKFGLNGANKMRNKKEVVPMSKT